MKKTLLVFLAMTSVFNAFAETTTNAPKSMCYRMNNGLSGRFAHVDCNSGIVLDYGGYFTFKPLRSGEIEAVSETKGDGGYRRPFIISFDYDYNYRECSMRYSYRGKQSYGLYTVNLDKNQQVVSFAMTYKGPGLICYTKVAP